MASSTTLSNLENLPLELKQLIMRNVGEPSDLAAIALTGPSMYVAFTSAAKDITTHTCWPYLQEMQALDVLPEALVELTCRTLAYPPGGAWTTIIDFCSTYLDERQRIPLTPTSGLSIAIKIVPLFKIVRSFAQDFASKALLVRPDKVLGHPPTTEELGRIMRAFYRFEMFRNLIRGPHLINAWQSPLADVGLQRHYFLDKFAHHENEQYVFLCSDALQCLPFLSQTGTRLLTIYRLACVLDYLFELVDPGTILVSSHIVSLS